MADRKSRTLAMAGTVCAVFVAVLVVATVVGNLAYRRSFDAGRELEGRVADARLARCLAPWDGGRTERALVMERWLYGRNLLEAGDYSGAVKVLRLAYRADVGNEPLLALFRRAQEIEALATNRKAHLQHGHEGPGSVLRPEDIER